MDTTPFVNKYITDKDHTYNWQGLSSLKTYRTNVLKVIIITLKFLNKKSIFEDIKLRSNGI